MQTPKIPVYKPTIGDLEKKFVNQCLDTEWISSKGEFVEKFEDAFRIFSGAQHAIAVSNGTTALHTALLALGIGPGDEVIVPTLTYVAAANAIAYTGATPVFVDSEIHTWQVSTSDLRKAIGLNTKAILVVHLYGQACDMNEILDIAEEHDLLVIEDCAEAIGTRIGEKHVGTFGDVSTFSFYGNKTITTGEGGMVISNNLTTAERCRLLKGQGLARYREYWHEIIGYNYRMTNVCAAIGLAQLTRIKAILGRKREIAKRYIENLDDMVTFQQEGPNTTHSYWMTCFKLEDAKLRSPLRNELLENGVETRPVFYPVHSMPIYAKHYRRMPVAESIASCGINLPSYPELTNQQVDFISNIIIQFLKRSN